MVSASTLPLTSILLLIYIRIISWIVLQLGLILFNVRDGCRVRNFSHFQFRGWQTKLSLAERMLVLHNVPSDNHLSSIITTIGRSDYHVSVVVVGVSIHNFLVEWIIIRVIARRRDRWWIRSPDVVFARRLLLRNTNKSVVCRDLLTIQMLLLGRGRDRRGRGWNSWIIYPQ